MGATASGKTEISILLAKKINAEIVSADSRQIYKHLRAGTAKPQGRWITEKDEKKYLVDGIPYHLVDFLDPIAQYNAGEYSKDANQKINEIFSRGKEVIVTGGTGLYIHSLLTPMDHLPKTDFKLRSKLLEYSQTYGKLALYEKLKKIDPVSATKIHPNNIQRVIRAIEISTLTGKPASSLISGNFFKNSIEFPAILILLKWPKNLLTKRIMERTISSFDEWVNETKNLISKGYPYDCPGLKSIGYSAIIDFIENRIDKKKAIDQVVKLSVSYAKRQNTWFSRYKDARIFEFKDLSEFKTEKIVDDIIEISEKQ